MTPLRTVLDAATAMPFPEALAVADGALAYGLVRQEELIRAAETTARGAGRLTRLRVARAADGRAANAFESALRGVLIDGGLAGFEPQVRIALPGGGARVDLADRALRLVLEADSYEFHGTRSAFARDCGRYNALVAEAWTVLRFPWEDVMFKPALVVSTVRSVSDRLRELAKDDRRGVDVR